MDPYTSGKMAVPDAVADAFAPDEREHEDHHQAAPVPRTEDAGAGDVESDDDPLSSD